MFGGNRMFWVLWTWICRHRWSYLWKTLTYLLVFVASLFTLSSRIMNPLLINFLWNLMGNIHFCFNSLAYLLTFRKKFWVCLGIMRHITYNMAFEQWWCPLLTLCHCHCHLPDSERADDLASSPVAALPVTTLFIGVLMLLLLCTWQWQRLLFAFQCCCCCDSDST